MRYMLMLHADETAGQAVAPGDMARFVGQMYAYQQAPKKASAFVSTDALAGSSEASIFRVQAGDVSVLDGQYADVREQFGGYFIIDVADMDEATKWAARCPAATWGSIEMRRIAGITEDDPTSTRDRRA